MIRLLSINNYYYVRGGAETVFFGHNAIFNGIGWDVAVFSMHHPKNIDSQWSRYFVDEIEFGSDYSVWGKIRRTPKVIYSFESRRKIDKLLDKFHAGICHAHNIYHHISPSVLGAVKSRGVPIVMTLHDLKIACPAYNMLARDGICERCKNGKTYNVLLHRCIKNSIPLSAVVMLEALTHRLLGTYKRHVDRFVVPSRFYLNKLVEWGWAAERFVHIPNFVDVKQYQADYNVGQPYLYFGRLSREKGLATLIKATAMAETSLRIAGTGPEEAPLRELARKIGAKVEFLGYQTGTALHNAIRSARAVVLPSEWYENAPMTILESYALGKPVIGSDIGGIPELIRREETGFIFTSGSMDALAEILQRVSDLPDHQLSDMGHNARQWAESEFSQEIYREKMLALYRQLGISC